MIVGVLSDTHYSAPGAGLAALLGGPLGDADVIVHAGDHTDAGVVDHLEYVDPRPYYGVAGNCDSAHLGSRLGTTRVFSLEGVTFGLVHGWGSADGLARRVASSFPTLPRVVVFGHSHVPEIFTSGATLFINPGSPTQPRGPKGRSVALITIEGGSMNARILEI